MLHQRRKRKRESKTSLHSQVKGQEGGPRSAKEDMRERVHFPCAHVFTGPLGEIETGVEILFFDAARGG